MGRLVHIDFLKGLAIFLMVMGHVLSWSMDASGCPRTVNSWFVREVIYSFHMPLFMFMSGYVIDLKNKIWDGAVSQKAVSSRLRTLVLPCVSFKVLGIMMTLLAGGNIIINGECPWFLRALFEIVLVFTIIKWIAHKLGGHKTIIELLCYALGYCLIFCLTRLYRDTVVDEWVNFTQFQIMYPYFVLGYLFRKYEQKNHSDSLYTAMIIIYAIAFYFYQYRALAPSYHSILRYVLAVAGIYIVYLLAINFCKKDNKVVKVFSYMGIHSIEIYLLSNYFIPRCPQMARLIYETSLQANECLATSIFLQLVFGLVLSIYCVLCCLLVMKIVERSHILGLLFFGRK